MSVLEDELAEATDALLSGKPMPSPGGENRELIAVVQSLYGVIDPARGLSADYRQRLASRLNLEWQQQQAAPTLRLIDRPLVRLAGLAAAVVLVLGAIVVLAVPDAPDQLQGAAIGLNDGLALLVLVGVAAGGMFFYWRSRR
jgi:hypothetical protein